MDFHCQVSLLEGNWFAAFLNHQQHVFLISLRCPALAWRCGPPDWLWKIIGRFMQLTNVWVSINFKNGIYIIYIFWISFFSQVLWILFCYTKKIKLFVPFLPFQNRRETSFQTPNCNFHPASNLIHLEAPFQTAYHWYVAAKRRDYPQTVEMIRVSHPSCADISRREGSTLTQFGLGFNWCTRPMALGGGMCWGLLDFKQYGIFGTSSRNRNQRGIGR